MGNECRRCTQIDKNELDSIKNSYSMEINQTSKLSYREKDVKKSNSPQEENLVTVGNIENTENRLV